MQKNKTPESKKMNSNPEFSKRKKEFFLIFLLSVFVAVLVGIEVTVFRSGQTLPAPYILYFIGLVNLNLVLVLLLLFLIFRNVVKIFVEKRSRIYGSSLKTKFTLAFAAFSVFPTLIVLIISIFYLNSSFEKWFSQRMLNILKNASGVIDSFIVQEKRKGFEYGDLIVGQIESSGVRVRSKLKPAQGKTPRAAGQSIAVLTSSTNDVQLAKIKLQIEQFRKQYSLDAVEIYFQSIDKRILSQNYEQIRATVPFANREFLDRGFNLEARSSTVQVFADSHLLRMMVPIKILPNQKSAIVISQLLNLNPGVKFDDIVGSYQEFQNNLRLEVPLKSMYYIMLSVMTLVTLFAAVWFGFYLAKQLSVPLVQLGRATRRVAGGDYGLLEISSGQQEISDLITNFNQMISNLSSSELELQQTLRNLNQYTKYVEIVLSNVSAGVVSVDMNGQITTMNQRAGELLSADPKLSVGHHIRNTMSPENYRLFSNFVRQMQENNLSSLQKEVKIEVKQEWIPLSIHISILRNEIQEEIGRIMVFDDLTIIQNAQRAAAWSEVARRIAHEIKNPLTPIRLAAERIQKKYGAQIPDDAFHESLRMIVAQVDDMRNLVNEFSQYARMPLAKKSPQQLNDVLRDLVKIYSNNHPDIQFSVELDQDLPVFSFDQSQIKRVIVNLVENAIAAAEKEQKPEITIMSQFVNDFKILKISIIDNGVGIATRDRQRIFEPYFSTKEMGTGLGLPIVKSIIEDHGGIIRALPNSPRGTKMYIELPIQT
jgi:two-component system, NtrC family, nitrogen regulation sensor histidine kinase NtrY